MSQISKKPEFKEPFRLESPLSIVKMDLGELEKYTARLNDFLKDPGLAAIRICECCIHIT